MSTQHLLVHNVDLRSIPLGLDRHVGKLEIVAADQLLGCVTDRARGGRMVRSSALSLRLSLASRQ